MIDPAYKRDNLLTVQVDDRPDGAKTQRFRMQIGVDANKMVTLYLTDLSEVLAQQFDSLHHQLMQGMENNYSHEQLTPLNNIMNSSKFLYSNLKNQPSQVQEDKDIKQCLGLSQQILCSSQILYQHTKNQILSIQHYKGQMMLEQFFDDDPKKYVTKAMQAFQSMMKQKNITFEIN